MTAALVLLEISKLTPPVPEGDVSMMTVLGFAVLNPVVAAIAFMFGRSADQWPKLMIAAFAGAIAGIAVVWVLAYLRVPFATSAARAAAGIFVVSLIVAFGWAALGYSLRRSTPSRRPAGQ